MEQVDKLAVHITHAARSGIGLLLPTGSDAHVDALHGLARRKGLGLDRNGVSRNGRIVAQGTYRRSMPRSVCRTSRRSCARPARRYGLP
jgi:hypothetical protein